MFYYNSAIKSTPYDLGTSLANIISQNISPDRETVLLCIGSDRSTGDSLGPLIGYKLSKLNIPGLIIYGTLDNPVHAANLTETIKQIYSLYANPYIIAVDASLGKKEHIGYITLSKGSLKPGLGVNKDLPAVGDVHITGIVNFSGMLDNLLLQTTRLSVVMNLADSITHGIVSGMRSIVGAGIFV